MLNKLQKNPNEVFTISDDNEAKILLLELGLFDQFKNKVEGIDSTNQTVTGECKTHFILALFFTGKTLDTDNGYIVHAFPKSKVSIEQMGIIYNQIMTKIADQSINLVSVKHFNPFLTKTSN